MSDSDNINFNILGDKNFSNYYGNTMSENNILQN